MKRRTFVKTSAAAAAAVTLPAIVRPSRAADVELLVPGVLSSATEGTSPPFSLRKPDGQLDGLEMRIMGEICNRLGLRYKPVVIRWDSMLVALLADQYDIVGNAMGITRERQKQVTFCDGWVESGARLVVREDSAIQDSSEVGGKSVGVITASIFVDLAEGWGAEVKHYKADVEAMQNCVNGRVDAIVLDSIAAAYAIRKSGLPLRWTDELHIPYQLGWAVRMGRPNLVRAVNRTWAAMVADGTVKELFEDLIGYDPSPRSRCGASWVEGVKGGSGTRARVVGAASQGG